MHKTPFTTLCAVALAVGLASPTFGQSTYQFEVLRDNPLYYWTFDEDSGSAEDQINGGPLNELVPAGSATRQSHADFGSGLNLGNTASFNGTDGGRFRAANLDGANLAFVPTQLWAAEMWVQLNNTSSPGNYLLESSAGGLNDPGLIYGFDFGNGPDDDRLEMFRGGRTGATGPTIDDNDFHHVVFAFYGNSSGFGVANRRDIIIDGVTFSDTSSDFSAGFGLEALSVGATEFGIGLNPTNGRIDELAIYDIGSMLSNDLTFGNSAAEAEFESILQKIAGHASLASQGDSDKFIVTPESYAYDPDGIQPDSMFVPATRDDPDLTKLTDGIIGRTNGGGAANIDSGQWVGFPEDVFGVDTGTPHPGVTFDLGEEFSLAEIWVDYMAAGGNAGVEAPDSVDVSFSNDGINFGDPLTFTGFNDQDTAGNNFFSRRLIVDLDGTAAQYINLSFNNDNQWTFLSEVTFVAQPTAVIPEPTSLSLLGLGLCGFAGLRRRQR